MRKIMNSQMQFGEVDISQIEFDLRCRDETPKLLIGLRHIYCTPELRAKVFEVLKDIIPEGVDPNNGCPGMDLWKIFVLGTLRLNSNWDYDKLHDIANNHMTLRQMIGHGIRNEEDKYALQTLKDNVSLFTPEILERINQVVVEAGHILLGKKKDDLKGRCDSFVVETNVHYPTDINLLFDAIRKVIGLTASVCSEAGIPGWRQSRHNIRKVKKLFLKAQNLYRSKPKKEKRKVEKAKLIKEAHLAYLGVVKLFLSRVGEIIREETLVKEIKLLQIEGYIKHAERQMDQVQRRVLNGETIPHDEKVFSIFEQHTEWISKGKAGVPQELGLRVCLLEDQFGFILHHLIMEKQTDDKVAVPITRGAKERFPNLNGCSYDKGFYSPSNRIDLQSIIEKVILPKKGKLSSKDKEIEYSEEFIKLRRQHSAVESAINALENHSLDRCPDHGIDGFKRYVALAIVARNIQILGNLIQEKELKRRKRLEKLKRKKYEKRYSRAA
jgi:IS5 family transposase